LALPKHSHALRMRSEIYSGGLRKRKVQAAA
jgi:hypothetical protein